MDDQQRICTNCGFPSAKLKRLDHYLSLFFIPVFRVKKGECFIECDKCGNINSETLQSEKISLEKQTFSRCPKCEEYLPRNFKYCPLCGKRLL